jgi:UMF1 family MFS transporter
MTKKIFYWALYDFANSIVLMAFLFYFSQWLVIDQGKPAWWYNAALILSSALFIISAPQISKRIDATQSKIAGLRRWTIFSLLGFSLVALMALFTDGQELLATILYTLATFAYLVCFLYYTPMLNDLSHNSNRSWISGIGQGANSIGQVFGILVVLPFVNGLTLFGDPGRAQALLPAVVLFGLLSLPMLTLYREEKKVMVESRDAQSAPSIVSLFKSVFSHRSLAFMFLAYFLVSDSMMTFANNFPLYLEVVFKASDVTKSLLTAAILVLAAVGAIIFGKISDKAGNVRTLRLIVVLWCGLLLLMALTTRFSLAIPIFLAGGILFGPVWAISRSLVGQLAPDDLVASSYSYYVVAERFATFIGPAVWSIVLVVMGEGALGYRSGLVALAILLFISLFALNKVKEPLRKDLIRG